MSLPSFDIAVLISGSGSNLQALIDQQAALGFRITLVLSNNADAYGLVRAQQAGIATCTINHKDFTTREAFEQAMIQALDAVQPKLIVLAGFMRILTPLFIEHYTNRLVNIHPSLLPKFKGTHTHAQAIAAGEVVHGASVHWVTPELDSGQVIAQASVPVMKEDTPELLAKRVLVVEHQLYPAVVAAIARGLVTPENTPTPPMTLPQLLNKVAA
ncbi:MAG: phosphoribosylglycinamide formyltransferase [Thiotrichales bacterium]|nr:phosphoribosylglycinamide formyltransferase [Thiotrichales bacterium]